MLGSRPCVRVLSSLLSVLELTARGLGQSKLRELEMERMKSIKADAARYPSLICCAFAPR